MLHWNYIIRKPRVGTHGGERNGAAKLTDEKVLEIRNRGKERQLDLANEYGVSEATIFRVIKRMNWQHI